jgi:hypothetical protein
MGFRITSSYHWYLVPKEPPILAKIYYIDGMPFDLDHVEDEKDLEIISKADKNKGVHADDMFKKSDYLIAEMMHPLLFDVDVDNPEELPSDYVS